MYIHSLIHSTNVYEVPMILRAGNQSRTRQIPHSEGAQMITLNLQEVRTCILILQMRKWKLRDVPEVSQGHRDGKSAWKGV